MKLQAGISLFMMVLAGCASPKEPAQAGSAIEWNDSLKAEYMSRGKKLAKAGFQALSSTLEARMADLGPKGAVEACNLLAHPITDSVGAVHQASIRRTSLRVRNFNNIPDEAELAQLMAYQEAWERGDSLQPFAAPLGPDSAWVTVPIMLQAQCVVCHGKPGATLSEDLAGYIRQQYPQDEATGFAPGDFRGMWSIRMKR